MLYDVTDTGQPFGHGVRESRTNVKLPFHIDNAFGTAVPRYVELMCIRPAKEGGISRFCSLCELHDRLLAHHPRALERLYPIGRCSSTRRRNTRRALPGLHGRWCS